MFGVVLKTKTSNLKTYYIIKIIVASLICPFFLLILQKVYFVQLIFRPVVETNGSLVFKRKDNV